MLKNYFKIAWRHLWKSKVFSLINISGLAIGLMSFLLIALYVGDESSYDRFHENADRIVRVTQHARWNNNDLHQATTSAPFAPALQAEFPEIEEAARILTEGGGVIRNGSKTVIADDIFFADKSIFSVFTYPFVIGDPATALASPESIVITESLASKLFSSPQMAINQTVYFENNYPNTVTGVIRDVPGNTHLHFSALRSLPENYTGGWQQFNVYTYLLLKKGTDYRQLEQKLPAFAAKSIQKMMQIDDYKMELQPLTAIHLYSNLAFETGSNGSISRVYIFAAIALLILLIAVINYVNLSTARATVRIREVGVRKVVGSSNKHLAGMFMTEAVLQTFLAAVVAIFLVLLLLPFFNELSGKDLGIWRFGHWPALLAAGALGIVIGLASGSYPAFFLSRFKTIPALRGQSGKQSSRVLFRQSLVVFQFVVTMVMIAGSLVIYRQLQYASGKDLGFNKDQVLTFHIHDQEVREQTAAIKAALQRNALIRGVAVAGNPIGNNNIGGMSYWFENEDGSFSNGSAICQELMIDEDYLPTMEIRLIAGRNFAAASPADKYGAALVNETLVKKLGWKNPVGKRLRFSVDAQGTMRERTVIGVVNDFHTYSLQHKVEPMVMVVPPMPSMGDNVYVKINTGKTAEALAYLEAVYKRFDSTNPFSYNFLDQNFARQYGAEQKQEQLSLAFTILAVLIACLGLFGLATFATRQRVKEIGIRKVLGASVGGIAALLSRDFIKLVLIAIVIGTPVAWFVMNRWLEGFAYRIEIRWWMLTLAALLAVAVALITVSLQSVKAALMNPVKSLKSE
ncbi:putative ABC transport system permease protein [Anseongella ginsenosidimutans]|uniref:Putative ABC transport system permease protein n=1 Tax=Anseongella ginsenosidimutans TaxID=496056 RepID=A0A4R3KM79_9SPHI|nr:ABC transporter permease [Anseongella ginsenosidimutans]QEC51919.1 FtsX-like permease family protein [Anseongella ginsenosidimutans]TCS85055.1 putative ABC transport system permease protein [Anseongella ginsenosidimutans]